MKIWKFKLSKEKSQLVEMPEHSEILDIQMQDGEPVMWALVNEEANKIDINIHMYGTGWEFHENESEYATEKQYLATVQDGEFVWHFFMNYEI